MGCLEFMPHKTFVRDSLFSFIVIDIGDGAKTSVSPANTLRVVPEFVTDTTALKSPEGEATS